MRADPNIDDFCEDFDGALDVLVNQVTARVDADTAGMNEIQLAEYWLASANDHLAEMQRIEKLNPVPEFLMEQAQDRVGRQQDRVRAVSQARIQAIDDCIKVAHEVAVMLGKFHGPSKPRSEIYRAEGANIVASRLEALKPASSGEPS